MNIANMKPSNQAVTVTETSLPTGIIFKNKHIITNINCWHKFIVYNTDNLNRNTILRAILDHVHPLDLIPVAFSEEGSTCSFLARNCGAAIQKLCNDNLVVPKPKPFADKGQRPFKLTLILKFATTAEFKIDVQKNIQNVLIKRYDVVNKTLDLKEFHNDPDLSEFCPLSQPKIMFFVLHLSKNLTPHPEKYILRNNHIKVLSPLEAVCSSNAVSVLDLGNNEVSDIKELQIIKTMKLKELVLDGNPLCANYNSQNYVQEIQNYCTTLRILDNVPLKVGNFPITKRNYVCDSNGMDLVNQFIEHFYTIYDSKNRRFLEELYHRNALFSLNNEYHQGQISSVSSELWKYNNISRNLKKISDVSRHSQFLYRGQKQIVNALTSLPLTEHDPFSFTVDLMYYTSRCGAISVTGVFRELPENLLDAERVYGFKRIFVVEVVNGDGLCYIVNDMFHIYNALSFQTINSFKVTKPVSVPVHRLPVTQREYRQVTDALKIITNLNAEWAQKCLEECDYDIKKALALFVDLYKVDRIPSLGFHN